jgi:hypothetical protein
LEKLHCVLSSVSIAAISHSEITEKVYPYSSSCQQSNDNSNNAMSTSATASTAQAFVDRFNADYEAKHEA